MTGAHLHSGRPAQAVIFAGGRGERMRPLTDELPKPMIEINGRPFLEYLVELLREQGITRILLLLGYRAHVIQDHFGDGTRWGVHLDYSVTAVSDETGRRLALARPKLDETFLLLYGDNYWPLRLDDAWERFCSSDADAMITVYRNRDALTRNNVRSDIDDRVLDYDPSHTASGLNGVEIGYMIMPQQALTSLSEDNVPFGQAVLRPLAQLGRLVGFSTDHRYYSVGSPDRLARTSAFLTRSPAVILDRDGVLNRRPPRAQYVCRWEEFTWLPGAREALRLFTEAGYRIVIATNQPGIARGALSRADLDDIHRRMRDEALAAGGRIDGVYVCSHGWHAGCECRKPRPGMLFLAQRDLDVDLTRTTMIGDDERDEAAARAAGARSRLVSESVSLLDHARALVAERHG